MTTNEKIIAGLFGAVAIGTLVWVWTAVGENTPERKSKLKGFESEADLLKKIKRKPDGEEKIVNESLHFGVGSSPYAYVEDLKKAGVKYSNGKNKLFGHLSKPALAKFVKYLKEKDGYLNVEA